MVILIFNMVETLESRLLKVKSKKGESIALESVASWLRGVFSGIFRACHA